MTDYKSILASSGSDRAGHLHPSAAGACLNRQLFEFYGVEAVHSQESLEIFRIGHAMHDGVQTAWTRAGILDHVEFPLALEELYVKGHADGIGQLGDTRFIFEIKSINPWGFHRTLPKPENVEQVQLYMYATGLRKALILYLNKNILDTGINLASLTIDQYMDGRWFKWFVVDYDETKIAGRIRVYHALKEKIDSNSIFDEIKYNPDDKYCVSCGYAHHCMERG